MDGVEICLACMAYLVEDESVDRSGGRSAMLSSHHGQLDGRIRKCCYRSIPPVTIQNVNK